MKKIIINICYYLVAALLIVVIGKNIVTFIDKSTGYNFPFFGFRESIIISDSMAFKNDKYKDFLKGHDNQFKKYDVVLTNIDYTYETLEIYDVITYRDPEHGLICHRIIDKYIDEKGTQRLVTRGDANEINDAPISYKDVAGRVYKIVPDIGEFLLYIQSPYGMLGVFGTSASICAGILIVDKFKSKKEKELETTAKVEEKPLKPAVYKREVIEDLMLKSKKVQNGGKYFIISRKNNKKDVE